MTSDVFKDNSNSISIQWYTNIHLPECPEYSEPHSAVDGSNTAESDGYRMTVRAVEQVTPPSDWLGRPVFFSEAD